MPRVIEMPNRSPHPSTEQLRWRREAAGAISKPGARGARPSAAHDAVEGRPGVHAPPRPVAVALLAGTLAVITATAVAMCVLASVWTGVMFFVLGVLFAVLANPVAWAALARVSEQMPDELARPTTTGVRSRTAHGWGDDRDVDGTDPARPCPGAPKNGQGRT